MQAPCVIVPNWNGKDSLKQCLDSLQAQSLKPHIIVVDNGSTDGSLAIIEQQYPDVELIKHAVNKGYAGGVNPGFRRAIELGAAYAAPFNNDAVADKHWLKELVKYLDTHKHVGIAACKLLTRDGKHLDSTGDYYTVWGLPYPRGRNESDINKYDDQTDIFAASGGASLFRTAMLQQIGLFDEDFFAYYEDVDLSFRAQLAGWKVAFVPSAIAYHEISATSSKIKGFATYQTLKNLPLLFSKNVPRKYLFKIGRRYFLAHFLFYFRALSRGQVSAAIKGDTKGTWLLITGYKKRRQIQKSRTVTDTYIWDMLVHDLPPNARSLRALRNRWRKLLRKKS
jgi:GT2 family glycosyltransferase